TAGIGTGRLLPARSWPSAGPAPAASVLPLPRAAPATSVRRSCRPPCGLWVWQLQPTAGRAAPFLAGWLMSEALRTVIPLAGRLCSGEVGTLLDPPVAEGDQIEEPVLSPDDWADLRRARPDQYGNHLGAPRAHVDQAQR